MIIENGRGTGQKAFVDQNGQLHAFTVTETEIKQAVTLGYAYNINTGTIGLTSTTESAVLYFKNDEDPISGESSFMIDAIAIGIGDGGTVSEKSIITVLRNPTAGTIVSGASAVSINANRNFGSSNALSSTTLAYKGAEGNTFTDGDDFALFYQTAGTRGLYSIDIELPKGSSIGIKIDTQTTAGTTDVYAALIGHRVVPGNRI